MSAIEKNTSVPIVYSITCEANAAAKRMEAIEALCELIDEKEFAPVVVDAIIAGKIPHVSFS
jgi:hypothetical protein